MKSAQNRYRPQRTRLSFESCFESGDTSVVFIDIETEGLDPTKDGIIQFSGRRYDYIDYAFANCDEFTVYINQHRPLDKEVIKISHITNELLDEKGVDEDEAFIDIKEFMCGVNVFVAYNAKFDYAFMRSLFAKYGETFKVKCFDVMAMCIDMFSIFDIPGDRSLKTFAKKFDFIEDTKNLHNATEDVRLTFNLFNRLFLDYMAYPVPQPSAGKPVPTIKYHWFWQNKKRPLMRRIYFQTNCGKLFYETIDRSFGVDTKEKAYKIDELDMEGFIKNVLQYFNVRSLEDVSHVKFESNDP